MESDSTGTDIEILTPPPRYSHWQAMDAVLSWIFGIVMLIAAIPHWENPYYFLGSVYAYKMVDPGLGQITAVLLPLTQLVIAICLITRFCINGSNVIAMILFGIFFTVQSYAYFGGLDISCGCFGPQNSMTIGVASLSLVGILLVLSMIRNISGILFSKSNAPARI